MTKPVAFVCVPGGSNVKEVYDPLIASLKAHGYAAKAVDLPSVGPQPGYDRDKGLLPDADVVRNATQRFLDQGKNVVAVAHSFGGCSTSQALESLGKTTREREGKGSGVLRIVYIASTIHYPNELIAGEVGDTSRFPPVQDINTKDGINIATVKMDMAKQLFFHDLPSDDQEKWASTLKPHSLHAFWSKLTHAAWQHIPSTYVFCTNDKVIPPAMVEPVIKDAQERFPARDDDDFPGAFDRIEVCDSGHYPFLSHVEWTTTVLRRAAGERV